MSEPKKKTSIFTIIFALIFFSVLIDAVKQAGAGGASASQQAISHQQNNAPSDNHSSVSEVDPVKDAISKIKFDYTWRTGGFDSIMMLDMTVANNGTKDISDFEVTCVSYAHSGTKVDSNDRVIYEKIPAGSHKKIKEFNMGFLHSQASSASCKITDLKV